MAAQKDEKREKTEKTAQGDLSKMNPPIKIVFTLGLS